MESDEMTIFDAKAFEGTNCIVTGGASGLGMASTRLLLALGANVAVWDVERPEGIPLDRQEFGKLRASIVDVTDRGSIESALRALSRDEWTPHVLINSAGIAGERAFVSDYPEAVWERVLDVNLSGVFRCTAVVLPTMVANGYGRILNVSSIAGRLGNPAAAAYCASKAGVIGFTKAVAREVVGSGVTVNSVAPAAFDTSLLTSDIERAEELRAKIPMGRFGTPEEFGHMVAWCVSRENSFTNGAVFDISGGRL